MFDWRKTVRRLGIALNLREPPNVPAFAWSYFDHLISLYVTINTADPRAEAVIAKSAARPDDLTWGDIFLLENIIFSLQPPEVVSRNAWIVRERFREIAGPTVFEKYVESGLPHDADTPANASLLRADLSRLLDVIHWYYALIPMRERIRKTLTVRCMLLVVTCTALLGWVLFWCYRHDNPFIGMFSGVIYWGILGGFVSSQRRMEGIPNDGDPLLSVFGLDSAGYYLFLSPLLGAIFAVVLLLMFRGGILSGSAFPAFGPPETQSHVFALVTFTGRSLPASGADYGKLFIWAFLAGFAERLVPDSLDRLSSRLSPSDRKKIPHPPASSSAPHHPQPAAPHPADKKISPGVLEEVMHTGEPPASENGQK